MSEQVNVQEQGQTPVQRVRNDWKTLVEKISYNAIVSNVPYLAFVAVLCVLYINNTQRAVEMQRELNKQNKKSLFITLHLKKRQTLSPLTSHSTSKIWLPNNMVRNELSEKVFKSKLH